jgi:hypothetical protein
VFSQKHTQFVPILNGATLHSLLFEEKIVAIRQASVACTFLISDQNSPYQDKIPCGPIENNADLLAEYSLREY